MTDHPSLALLPKLETGNPLHIEYRQRLVEVLQSQGEIVPAADSPLGKLSRLVYSDDSTIEECVEVISLDPALTSRIFRVANSGAYGGNVATLKEAVLFLGFGKLREVVFSAAIFHQLKAIKLPSKWNHFWIRNIFIARLTERISATLFRPTGSEYLSGLLHDIGWLLLISTFPEEEKAIFQSPLPLTEAEIDILSFSHADVSALLCLRSNLPREVIEAVQLHQDFDSTPWRKTDASRGNPRFLSVILRLSDQMASYCEMPIVQEDEYLLEKIEESPEAIWLRAAGAEIDVRALVEEELTKAQEVFTIFFMQSPAA